MLIGVYPRSSAAHKRFFHSFQGSGCPRWSKRVQREESDMFNFSSEQFRLNVGLAEMLKGGVIMDVTNVEEAKTPEKAGAPGGMALGPGPSEIPKGGGGGPMAKTKIME